MDYKNELEQIENTVNEKKLEKARLEERLKNLKEEEDKILAHLEKENIKPDELKDEIAGIEYDLQDAINKCKDILK